MHNPRARSALQRARKIFALYPSAFISAGLLLLMGLNMLAVISRKSLTNDEFYHIPAGYYHLKGNFRINQEHPPLVKMLAAVPLVFIRPAAAPYLEQSTESPILRGHESFIRFWHENMRRMPAISFWARVPMILLTLSFGALVFIYARQLFGPRPAIFAVLLFTLEPTMLAHGRVVQTDVPAAFAYLLFFLTLRNFVIKQKLSRALYLGFALGLALVTKFSLIIIVPIFIIAAVALSWKAKRKGKRLAPLATRAAVALLVMLLVVNVVYYFDRQPIAASDVQWIAVNTPASFGPVMRAIQLLSVFVPPSFLLGIYTVLVHNQDGHLAGLWGAYSPNGWWYYFPVAFALKTTLPFLLLSLAALGWTTWKLWRGRALLFLWPLSAIAIYTAFSMTSRINIGVRHFLPVFPFLMVLCGAMLDQLLQITRRRMMTATIVALLCGWMVFEAARAFPDYMSYMNQVAWRHPHWYYLSDSNVEWGDDAGALAEYLRARGETRVRAALLGGWLTFKAHDIEYVDALSLNPRLPETHYIAIGASYLNGSTVPMLQSRDGVLLTEEERRDFFAEYRGRTPEAVFGHSIYLYRVQE
ncbi:MAG TPA: glycosyltransferase family 39 protein [Pyrinomonadaceae bacterium]|jgi:4-amino-4-deoxy-L-arabinose transferase-like glycosyltransferase